MKNRKNLLAIAFMVVIAMGYMKFKKAEQLEIQRLEEARKEVLKSIQTENGSILPTTTILSAEELSRFNALKKKFRITTNPYDGSICYSHRIWEQKDEKKAMVSGAVLANGELQLKTFYQGEPAIGISQAAFLVNGVVYDSSLLVNAREESLIGVPGAGSKEENVFAAPKDDQLIRSIFSATAHNEKVQYVLLGERRKFENLLSDQEITALKEVVELSEFLRKMTS